MTMRSLIAAFAAASALSGCTVGPAPRTLTPPPTAPGAFLGAGEGFAHGAPVPVQWWQLFNDPALDAHIQRALAANTDLRVAIANLEVARASQSQADAARQPTITLESSAGPDGANAQPSTSSVPKTGYDLGATIGYEVDLFGRLRSAAAAARADVEASQAAMDTVRLSIVADVTMAYVDLCGATAAARIGSEQLSALQRNHDLIARQLRQGEVSPLELSQARAQLERVRATLPTFEADRRRAMFRMAVLEGMTPADADALNLQCTALPRIDAPIPVGDGAGLLARRPDIREADRRLVAATARIGVATADLYPRVTLGGSAGLIGGGLDAILTPLVAWVFPNRNAARARIASAQGTEQAALANWDGAVLRALRDVETALADYRAERARNAALVTALDEGRNAERRAQARFRLGADSYLIALDATRARLDTETQLMASNLRVAQIQVTVFRALGGGWEPLTPTATASR